MIHQSIITGTKLPELTNPGTANDLLAGKQLIDQFGNPLTGTIATKTQTDLSVSGSSIIVPAGYYASQTSKSVATATQATPSISVSSSGLITASATQSAGYVSSGTKRATKQLTTQSGKTITPSRTQQTAVSSGRYTTGTVYVAGDSDLIASNIRSGANIFGVAGTYSGPTFALEHWSKEGDGDYSTTFSADEINGRYFYFTVTLEHVPTGILGAILQIMEGYRGRTDDYDFCMGFIGHGFSSSALPDEERSAGAGGVYNGGTYNGCSLIVDSVSQNKVTLRASLYSGAGITSINDILVLTFDILYQY